MSQNEKSNATFPTYRKTVGKFKNNVRVFSTKLSKLLTHPEVGLTIRRFTMTYSVRILQQNTALLLLIGVLLEYVKNLSLFFNPVGGMDGRSVTKLAKS